MFKMMKMLMMMMMTQYKGGEEECMYELNKCYTAIDKVEDEDHVVENDKDDDDDDDEMT